MTTYGYTGATRFVTISQSGLYEIEADGAQGGTFNRLGGNGARISASFFLSQGTQLALVVGGQGSTNFSSLKGGGGGASWVFIVNADGSYTPLVVAGGGGGSTFEDRGGGAEGLGGSGLGGGDGGRDGSGGGAGFLERVMN